MRAACYARYSSDNQREASIADQLRLCRLYADRQGWTIVEEYADHAVSGASLIRPGIQALIGDATRQRFDVILTESLDGSRAIRRTSPGSTSAPASLGCGSSPCRKATSTSFTSG